MKMLAGLIKGKLYGTIFWNVMMEQDICYIPVGFFFFISVEVMACVHFPILGFFTNCIRTLRMICKIHLVGSA